MTAFFAIQAQVVRYYVERRYWTELDLEHFLKYMHGQMYAQMLAHPQRLGILKTYCDSNAEQPRKTSPTHARNKGMRKLSRRMAKLRLSPDKSAHS